MDLVIFLFNVRSLGNWGSFLLFNLKSMIYFIASILSFILMLYAVILGIGVILNYITYFSTKLVSRDFWLGSSKTEEKEVISH